MTCIAMMSRKGTTAMRASCNEESGEASSTTVFPAEPTTSKRVTPNEYPSMD
eukprot:CAMPEP_0115332808 /NCGR_PEP_ID=MMETSP0270-20121206/87038_1 /TAXON_ID=71861 /ORGANISM="Scrippsiella trochoidea, Strain CCMP3099" /LENGTH=51 /DNA_ID=CAMNT_0002753675 /DNA_START=89 /DNA_END=241 /DNA_ORIENTATION=+